jgi:hypothetical protein
MSETEKVPTLRPVRARLGPEIRPTVIEYKKPKKKKGGREMAATAKYSPELEDIQIIGTDAVRAAHKAASALEKGIDTYERERLRSAKEKKDGAIEDFLYNAGKAASVWMKEASDIPVDLTESVRRRPYSKRLRKSLRKAAKALRNWRM